MLTRFAGILGVIFTGILDMGAMFLQVIVPGGERARELYIFYNMTSSLTRAQSTDVTIVNDTTSSLFLWSRACGR